VVATEISGDEEDEEVIVMERREGMRRPGGH
jgi:hypothetical protein